MSVGYLLDTNVVSALGPGGAELPPRAVAWITRREASLSVSVVTIIEIESGLEKLRLKRADRKVAYISNWFAAFRETVADALIDVDANIATQAGRLIAREYAAGRQPEFADALIGATALQGDLALVTRNVRHFETFGIEVIDPFSI